MRGNDDQVHRVGTSRQGAEGTALDRERYLRCAEADRSRHVDAEADRGTLAEKTRSALQGISGKELAEDRGRRLWAYVTQRYEPAAWLRDRVRPSGGAPWQGFAPAGTDQSAAPTRQRLQELLRVQLMGLGWKRDELPL